LSRLPDQLGDVPQTWASVDKAARLLGYAPSTSFAEGLARFTEWLRESGKPSGAGGVRA
jgi:UDP-glucuronate 4-epimerase